MTSKILVVEDERAIQLALKGLLSKAGHDVVAVGDAQLAYEALETDIYDLVLTDLALGKKGSGMDVLAKSKSVRPETPVVMITAHGNEKVAVEAMKKGAADYVPKPFDNDELRLVIQRALDRTQLEREHRLLLDRIEKAYGFGALVGSGIEMRKVFETIKKVAHTDLTVLIRGESGTGKELVAQALHHRSPRTQRPFIAVNCAAISRELVESELFGHEKGAFTGADARRIGRFEAAEGGTIFLDEIGDMPLETQAKVLRVLQERVIETVGSTKPIQIDVRILAATHRDLEKEVEAGRFREDLYYRLAVVPLVLPPLRDRAEDIPALTQRFLKLQAERLSCATKTVSPGALNALRTHSWPGNVRELRNVVEQAQVMADAETIEAEDIHLLRPRAGSSRNWDEGGTYGDAKKQAVEYFERTYLLEALRKHEGNISRTAETIGLARQSLQQKIKELDLRSQEWT